MIVTSYFLIVKNAGVAVGSGWQALVAYVNIGCYYLIGIPFGVLLGWGFHYGINVYLYKNHIADQQMVLIRYTSLFALPFL